MIVILERYCPNEEEQYFANNLRIIEAIQHKSSINKKDDGQTLMII